MRDWIQNKPNDFIKEEMLSYMYKSAFTFQENTHNYPLQNGTSEDELTYGSSNRNDEKTLGVEPTNDDKSFVDVGEERESS